MERTFIIKDLETLRALADPIRSQILECVTLKPMTVKSVAEDLGVAPSKLYYHFSQLEHYGFIQVIETRLVGNMLEKIYRATAEKFDLSPGLLDFSSPQGKESISGMLDASLDLIREDLSRSLESRFNQVEQGAVENPRHVMVTRSLSRMSDEKANQFFERLRALVEEFEGENNPDERESPDLPTFAMSVIFYPRYTFPATQPGEDNNLRLETGA